MYYSLVLNLIRQKMSCGWGNIWKHEKDRMWKMRQEQKNVMAKLIWQNWGDVFSLSSQTVASGEEVTKTKQNKQWYHCTERQLNVYLDFPLY